MSGPELMAVVVFGITVFGVLFGMWRFVDGKIEKAKIEASTVAAAASALAGLTRQELAEHKLFVAQHYITKAGMRETTEQIMDAIQGVKQAVDHMALRVDRVVENQAVKPQPRRTT
ncbi:hypothetical protein [Pararhizobium sp.]|uniref:hypothetical protein n=1 Tax=Pararhizobium sp. TaxID=1977563 RepID=UPI003BA90B44